MVIAIRIVLTFVIAAGLTFGCAGRWDLPYVWAVFGVYGSGMMILWLTIDRGLLEERMRPGPGGQDRHLRIIMLPLFLAHLTIAGLDLRFGWTRLAEWPQWVGLGGLAATFGLSIWAMRVNRFFSPVVRIQSERGHHLVTAGPYAVIRHPGYLSAAVMLLSTGLAMGSLWSLVPFAPVTVLLIRRIVIEDRFLHDNLEGYTDYAKRVRFRVIPGVW